MALSSSVQFKSYLCNQVDDIAGNDVYPTKQAIRQRQGTKTPSVTERRKTLGETRLSLFQLQQSPIVRAPLVPVVFSRWMSRCRGPHWRSVSGAHLGVLVSADVQGCSDICSGFDSGAFA